MMKLSDVVTRLQNATSHADPAVHGKTRQYRVVPARPRCVCAECGEAASLSCGYKKRMRNLCTDCARKLLTPKLIGNHDK